MRRGTGTSRRWLGIAVEESPEAVAVGQGNDLGRGREADGGFRPGQQPGRLEPAEGGLEPLGGQPGEPLQLAEAEAAGQGGRACGSAGPASPRRRTRRGDRPAG